MEVDQIVVRATADTTQAEQGMNRLVTVINNTYNTTNKYTSSVRSNTKATNQNSDAQRKNASEHKKTANAVKSHASGLKRLSAALKRIVIYRALRGLIKSVTQAFAEGTKRMYEWSKANDQVFMKVMDTYSTEFQYLKDALGAATAPLLEALLPIVVRLIDGFVDLINIVNQFFRALAGYDTWLKVDKVAKQFQTDTEGAAKAQKALNNQLMDFDQLNLITTPKNNGSTATETPPLSGSYVPIDPKIAETARKLKAFFAPILADLGEIWDILKRFIDKLLPAIGLLLKPIGDTIAIVVSGVKDIFKKLEDSGALDRFASAFRTMLEKAQPFFDAINEIIRRLLLIIGEILPHLIDTISLFLPSVGASIGALGDIMLGVFNLAEGLLALLRGDVDSFFGHMGEALVNLGHGIIRLIKSILMAVANAIEAIMKPLSTMSKKAKKWLEDNVGIPDWAFVGGGSKYNIQTKDGAASFAIDDAFEQIIYDIDHIGQKTAETGDKISDTSHRTADDVLKDFQNTTAKAQERLNGMASNAKGASSRLVSDIKTELMNLMANGKISFGQYMELIDKISNGTKEEAKAAIDEANRLIKEFTGKAVGYASTFATDFSRAIKEALKNTRIDVAMNPGQQANWNKTTVTMQAYADGGFPDMGSMFVAGESGAEMVGSINGRTGVVSGDEISGIASAVYGTGAEEAALLRELIGAVKTQRLTISPSASLGKVMCQSTRLYAGVTG